jgi:hypothetical protein
MHQMCCMIRTTMGEKKTTSSKTSYPSQTCKSLQSQSFYAQGGCEFLLCQQELNPFPKWMTIHCWWPTLYPKPIPIW